MKTKQIAIWSALGLVAVLLTLTPTEASCGEAFTVPDLWGKKEKDLGTTFPDAKKEFKGYWVVEGWKGWGKVSLTFDTKSTALEMITFIPATPLSESEAKEIAQKDLMLGLPSENEVRAPGLIAYREMKGKVRTINFMYVGIYDRRIEQIAVFFGSPPMVSRPEGEPAPKAVSAASTSPTLGETLSECIRRYGRAEKGDNGALTFTHGGMLIQCRFFEGKCESAGFTKGTVEQFSDAEFQALREANSGGGKWELSPHLRFGGETWQTRRLGRFAVRWGNSPYSVFLQTRGALERLGGPYGGQIKREEAAKATQ